MTHYVDVQAGKAGEGTKRTETRHARVSILINPPKRGDKWMGVQGGLSKEDWSYNEKRGCPMVVRKRRQADVQRRGVDVQWWCPMVVVNGGEWWSGGLRWMDGGGRSRNRWVSKEERGQEGGKSRFTPLCLPAASIDLDASECALLPRGCWRAQSRDRRLLLPRDADRAA